MVQKDLTTAVLATFCLTATLLVALPTKIDPGKNVTIVGRTNELLYTVSNQTVEPYAFFWTPWITVDGYSRMTISVFTSAIGENGVGLYATHRDEFITGWGFLVDSQYDIGVSFVKTYDVPNELIRVCFINDEGTARSLWIDVYVIP